MHTTKLFATLCCCLSLARLHPAQAQPATPQTITKPTLTILHTFAPQDGSQLEETLTVGTDGALYSTALSGGVGDGTIFKVTRGGLYHKLADLYSQNGAYPRGPLLLMPDGSLMGTASGGGKSNTGGLFLLTPPHRFQTKHEFASVSSRNTNIRGAVPSGTLALGTDGAVYGTTQSGGTQGYGVVYRWTAAQGVQVLHDFLGGTADGDTPLGGVVLGQDGALYGTTLRGGADAYGIVFRLTTDGIFTLLHSFNVQDGAGPRLSPVSGPDGALYGVTGGGGAGDADGAAYRITPEGAFTLLHSFITKRDGGFPQGLTAGADGNLYGTTEIRGPKGGGTVFRLTPGGIFTILYAFPGNYDKGYPGGGVTYGPDGSLYGTLFGTPLSSEQSSVFRLRLPQ